MSCLRAVTTRHRCFCVRGWNHLLPPPAAELASSPELDLRSGNRGATWERCGVVGAVSSERVHGCLKRSGVPLQPVEALHHGGGGSSEPGAALSHSRKLSERRVQHGSVEDLWRVSGCRGYFCPRHVCVVIVDVTDVHQRGVCWDVRVSVPAALTS